MKTEQVECIVCEKKYPRRLKGRTGRVSQGNERGINTITCSPKCSKIFRRAFYQIRKKLERDSNGKK